MARSGAAPFSRKDFRFFWTSAGSLSITFSGRFPSFPEPDPMTPSNELAGQIERITYANDTNGFTIARLKVRGRPDTVTVVGHLMNPAPGTALRMNGTWTTHPKYGDQFKADSWEILTPAGAAGIRRYLGSGLIKGIGPRIAERIVRAFGEDTLNIIDTDIQRLTEVDGIGQKRIRIIRTAWNEQKEIRRVMLFLQSHGVSAAYAARIYRHYGDGAVAVVQENPYRLAVDIFGIGFKTADGIAQKLGMPHDSPVRAEAGILHALNEMADEGHVYYPYEPLLALCARMLNADRDVLTEAISRIAEEKRIRLEDLNPDPDRYEPNQKAVYLTSFHVCETGIARRLRTLSGAVKHILFPDADEAMEQIRAELSFSLAPRQAEAARCAMTAGAMILTGGPGTGKTTIITAILSLFSRRQARILLAAPTGRAARRMMETTGHAAATVHRLLQFSPATGKFEKNEKKKLDCDLLVLDESSMMDTVLFHHLLKAVPRHARLVLVGDIHQLPSVGPGNVLADIMASGLIPVVRLTEIFRQARESRIVTNAHRILAGRLPWSPPRGVESDFYFIEKDEPEAVSDLILRLVSERIPARFDLDPVADIQVITPMHRGRVGSGTLNRLLQERLNPDGKQIDRGLRRYRTGDKIMQIRNNYEKSVYNGDIGRVTDLDLTTGEVLIRFDGRDISYDFNELDETLPAWAVSVHKSQGSEYPAVVVPVLMQHYMLLQRNLIYTAVTRGKRLVVLVGQKKALAVAIRNDKSRLRHTRLAERLTGPSVNL